MLAEAEGIEDRDAAEALRGTELFVPRAALPEPAPDEFYHSDLEGLDALRADGARLGVVHGVDNFGAGDMIEIAADDGRRLSLPFTRAHGAERSIWRPAGSWSCRRPSCRGGARP